MNPQNIRSILKKFGISFTQRGTRFCDMFLCTSQRMRFNILYSHGDSGIKIWRYLSLPDVLSETKWQKILYLAECINSDSPIPLEIHLEEGNMTVSVSIENEDAFEQILVQFLQFVHHYHEQFERIETHTVKIG